MTSRFDALLTSKALALAICLACVFVIFTTFREVPELGSGGVLVDFDVFYLVGQMIHEGRLALAYDNPAMLQIQAAISKDAVFLPWTYPPQFDLVTALLPYASRGVAYALFAGLSLGAYVLVLRRLAGAHLTAVLVAILPAMVITLRIGQNGFVTGTLVGLFTLGMLSRRTLAGVPLGLMVIKPHLGIGLGVITLLTRRWGVLATGLAVVALTSGLATMAFGPEVWSAFLAAVPEAQKNLSAGVYPMFRMTSLFAALQSLGVPAKAALAAQSVLALGACLALLAAHLRGVGLRGLLGLACLATLAVSPYNYDYDMPILGVGLALIATDLLRGTSDLGKLGLLALCWLTTGWGLFVITTRTTPGLPRPEEGLLSLAAFGHLALFALAFRRLTRP